MTIKTYSETDIVEKKVTCGASPGCLGCGMLVKVKDNKIISRRGNPDHPMSRGHVCGKRFPHLVNWLEHPDQLKHPLKRAGERGENKWERITWDQALDEIADKLKNLKADFGPETLAFCEGLDRSDSSGIRARFMNLFGNPGNVGTGGVVCHCNRVAFSHALGGGGMFLLMLPPPEVMQEIRCFVFCGANFSKADLAGWLKLKKRLRQDPKANLIVIDPRRTEIAEKADMYLQIRPGTDAALFMAWMNVIIEEDLIDMPFIEEWTYGFDQLKKRAAEYTPERVAEITWISPEKIRESALMYARNKPAHLYLGLVSDQIGRNGLRVDQARVCLQGITGNMANQVFQRPTGPGPFIAGKFGIRDAMLQLEDKCPEDQKGKQLGSDRFKLMTWPAYDITNKIYKEVYGIPRNMSGHNFAAFQPSIWNAILKEEPYPVKAMITWCSNPLVTAANAKNVYKALKSPNLDLHVVLEVFMTPTALLADYVLPSASKLEMSSCSPMEDFVPIFACSEKAIEPMGERRPNNRFFIELAKRLGFGEYFPWETEEELHNYRLEPLGINFEKAAKEMYAIGSEPWTYETINPRTGKPTGFATPSGKLELYSNVLDELGYDPLPFYEEPPESPVSTPEVAEEYPLILNTGGTFNPQFQSEQRQLGTGMREAHPDPLMEIHPDTAQELGIAEGDWAYIETRRGVIKQKAVLTTNIHPRVVNVEHGWWFPEQPAREPWLHGLWQSNANVLTMDDAEASDPLSGSSAMRALLCKVYKVEVPGASS